MVPSNHFKGKGGTCALRSVGAVNTKQYGRGSLLVNIASLWLLDSNNSRAQEPQAPAADALLHSYTLSHPQTRQSFNAIQLQHNSVSFISEPVNTLRLLHSFCRVYHL